GRSQADLNQVSFGISAGLIQSRLDETQFDPTDFDPVIAGIIQSSSYFNADVGAAYYFDYFSAYFTAKNVLFQHRGLFNDKFEPGNQRTYMLASAYFIPTSYGIWSYEPSFLFQWKERTGEQSIDINFKAYREVEFGRIWGGISYRRSFDGSEFLDGTEIKDQKLQLITPVLGVNFKKFLFAYTYTAQSGSVKFDSGGFHQLTIGYNFLDGNISRWSQDMRYNGMLRPRGR
nr:type IX secretion system membrane protein PorP/SprF [Bacteroidota bacterium]